MSASEQGRWGECWGAAFLEKQGCRIVKRNFKGSGGEIDIIAQKGEFLLFVEVKSRREDSLSPPITAVSRTKQRRILRTAQEYLWKESGKTKEGERPLQPRFDVLSIVWKKGRDREVLSYDYLENAFDAGGAYVF